MLRVIAQQNNDLVKRLITHNKMMESMAPEVSTSIQKLFRKASVQHLGVQHGVIALDSPTSSPMGHLMKSLNGSI